MSETPSPAPNSNLEAKKAPITLAEVLQACQEIDSSGTPLTRRAVREKLGRGSMTTIHHGVSQYESQKAPPLPVLALTDEDQSLIASFTAQAFAIAESRVQAILSERDAIFQQRITREQERADDAITAAEAIIASAHEQARLALAACAEAEQHRDKARQEAQEAKEQVLLIKGQLAQLSAEKSALASRLHHVEAEAALLQTRAEIETVNRQKAETATASALNDLSSLRRDFNAKQNEDAQVIDHLQTALSGEQARCAELKGAQQILSQTLHSEQQQRQSLLADLAEARAALAGEQARSALLLAESIANKERLTEILSRRDKDQQQTNALETLQDVTKALAQLLRQPEQPSQD